MGESVLAVEDDRRTAELLSQGLIEAGHDVTTAERGEDALAQTLTAHFDAIILDVSLPGIDGHETCRRLRARGDATPVLMLTAGGAVADRVLGLDSGADDYLVKPYHLDELLARLRALARRSPVGDAALLETGTMRLDVEGCTAWRSGEEVQLTLREARVLEVLMREAGRVLTRTTIADLAWDGTLELNSNVVDVHIRSLRRKLDEPFSVRSIETVRGAGYRLRRDAGA
jgi:two-component system OmpR family response regulator